jgi:hypothetical protein
MVCYCRVEIVEEESHMAILFALAPYAMPALILLALQKIYV